MNNEGSWVIAGIQSSAFTKNVALRTQGSTCTASSEHGPRFSCRGAIDGITPKHYFNEWASRNEGTRAWIQITLPRPVYVIRIKAINRNFGNGDEVKRASVLFDNNQSREVTN